MILTIVVLPPLSFPSMLGSPQSLSVCVSKGADHVSSSLYSQQCLSQGLADGWSSIICHTWQVNKVKNPNLFSLICFSDASCCSSQGLHAHHPKPHAAWSICFYFPASHRAGQACFGLFPASPLRTVSIFSHLLLCLQRPCAATIMGQLSMTFLDLSYIKTLNFIIKIQI